MNCHCKGINLIKNLITNTDYIPNGKEAIAIKPLRSSSKGFKISLSQKLSKADQDRLQQLLEEKLREMI
jgi:hypothetical protein